jgi:formyl-CoA transferase
MAQDAHLLDGIRVVEVATLVAVPSATMMMTDFGAEVIKVEPPDQGDPLRRFHFISGMPVSEIPYTWLLDSRNKKSVALDLKQEAGLEALHKLIETADVFVTNMRASALEKLELTYEDLRALNPRLIYALGTGFGEVGPDAHKPGYDIVTFWSRTGLEDSVFPVDGWLSPVPAGIGDHTAGVSLMSAILLALYGRSQTGEGRKVSVSLLAHGIYANSMTIQARLCEAKFRDKVPREEIPNFAAVYYKSRDGKIFRHAVFAENMWPPFCRVIDRPELIDDPRFATRDLRMANARELIELMDEVFAERDWQEWQTAFEEHDVAYGLIATYDDVMADPQLEANNVFVDFEHPSFGRLRTVNSPMNVEGQEKVKPMAGPELGQHTTDVLTGLGYSQEETDRLISSGAAAQGEAEGGGSS